MYLKDCFDCRHAFSQLLDPFEVGYYERESQSRLRLPLGLKWQVIKELEVDYADSPFGDLREVFREMAGRHWGLMQAGTPLVLDPSLNDCMILDVLAGVQKKRRGRPPVSFARALLEV